MTGFQIGLGIPGLFAIQAKDAVGCELLEQGCFPVLPGGFVSSRRCWLPGGGRRGTVKGTAASRGGKFRDDDPFLTAEAPSAAARFMDRKGALMIAPMNGAKGPQVGAGVSNVSKIELCEWKRNNHRISFLV
jgi:hypothetical protein